MQVGDFMVCALISGFGAAMAVFSVRTPIRVCSPDQWAGQCMMLLAGLRAAFHLFDGAWLRVMRSPTGWHDCTPVSLHLKQNVELRPEGLSADSPKVGQKT